MTKKTFIALADVVRELDNRAVLVTTKLGLDRKVVTFEDVLLELAWFCQSQNPRFNRARWIAYINGECGPNGGQRKTG